MRVLIGSDTYPPDVNGASHFTHRLASGLAGRGHEVHVIAPSPSGREFSQEYHGVHVHRLPSHKYPLVIDFQICMPWSASPAIARLLDRIEPDVVHVQNHFITGRFLAAQAQRRGIALVATNHFMPENLVELARIPGFLQRAAARWAWADLTRSFGRAQVVTAPTPRAVELLQNRTPLRDVQALSCGIDTEPYERAAAAAAEAGGAPLILFVGRLDQEKRVNELIDAVALLPSERAWALEIIGDGQYRRRWESQVADRGIAERVRFRGFVDREELNAAYGRCDVFVMPGVAELQSLVTLEAMAAGKPVIAAAAMALPHLVHPGENGYLFTPGDVAQLSGHLDRLLADADLRRRFGEQSHRIVAEHAIENTLRRFESLYEQAQSMVSARR